MHYAEARTALVLIVPILTAVNCGGEGEGPGGRGAEQARIVLTSRAEAVDWTETLELGSTLEAPERVEIAARIEGVVVGLEVDLGDRVRRGDTLARLTSEDFSARVARTEAELAQARSELARAEQLVERDLASRDALERAQMRAHVAEAEQRLAGRQLRDTRVIAPFDGAIAERLVSPGSFVRVGAPLFVLVATSPLRLALDVPERHVGELRIGTPVRIGHGSETIDAAVTRVSPTVDPASRTFRAEVEVAVEGEDLRPGMYVEARVELGAIEGAVAVPRAAVFEVLGTSRVVLVVDGRAEPRDVELVGEDDGSAIVRGLAAGAEVVTRSPGLLAPGSPVQVERAEDPEARAERPRSERGAP